MRKVDDFSRNPKSNDPLTRCLLSKSYFAGELRRVKPSAFIPPNNPTGGIFRTSVFQIKGLTESEVWSLGYDFVLRDQPGRRLHARADISVQNVWSAGLDLDADNNPPRHASIVGWPETKAERKVFALKLAGVARLVLNPT